jgi:hypothetical protein
MKNAGGITIPDFIRHEELKTVSDMRNNEIL